MYVLSNISKLAKYYVTCYSMLRPKAALMTTMTDIMANHIESTSFSNGGNIMDYGYRHHRLL